MLNHLRIAGTLRGNVLAKAKARLPTIFKLSAPKLALEASKMVPLAAHKLPLRVYGVTMSASFAFPVTSLCMDSILDEDVDLSVLEGGESAGEESAGEKAPVRERQ